MLKQYDYLPDGFLGAEVSDLRKILKGPALIHLPGEKDPPLFVSILQHGNEDTGFYAVREWLLDYHHRRLPRSLTLFVANVFAAEFNLRCLAGQLDFNRVWPGAEPGDSPEHRIMNRVLDIMKQRGVFASIDIHNTSGFSPHYAAVNSTDPAFLRLAMLYDKLVVFFEKPVGVQSQAFSKLCPAVILECGKAGEIHGREHVRGYLDTCICLDKVPCHPIQCHEVDLFHTIGIIKIPDNVSFGFGYEAADIQFADDLDRLNFKELLPGKTLGVVTQTKLHFLDVIDDGGFNITDQYYAIENQRLIVRKPLMLSMLTKDKIIIRQDCLCYLMERYQMS